MTGGRLPVCADCGGPDARTSIGGVSRCDGCCNSHISAQTGWPSLPAPPGVETLRAGDGREVRIRYRLTWTPSGLLCAEAEEADLPPGDGFRFVVYGERDADPQEVLDRLHRIVQREVARAYLEPSGVGEETWAIAGSEVAGRVDWSGDGAVRAPSVVVDGRRLTWEAFGRLVASFEGWGFWMRFDDSSGVPGGDVDRADARVADSDHTEVVPSPDDRVDAEVVPLFGARGVRSAEQPETPSIDVALTDFLADQEARLAASTFARYEGIVDGSFMVRKVAASKQQLKDAGTVTKRLARWLADQGYVAPDAAEVARERAADAGRQLPRADELGEQLFLQAKRTRLPVHPDDIADEDWVEDLLPITRVEDGRLWFGDFGPVEVPAAASDLAEVGWDVSVVLARLDGTWRLVEVGSVYP